MKDMTRNNLPVGVFDSGVGGVSVLREMVKLLPNENFIFFGDSANAPYGMKTPEEIRALTLRHAAYLYSRGIKALVIACNTATSAAIVALREQYRDIPVIGIEPAVKPAALIRPNPLVLILATPMTIAGEKLHLLTDQFSDQATFIPVACPGMMEFVEEGKADSSEVSVYLKELLKPYLSRHVDAVVLGCTHYPFLRGRIREVIGDRIPILDGSAGTARQLRRQLVSYNLLSDRTVPGTVSFEMSIPERTALAEKLFNA